MVHVVLDLSNGKKKVLTPGQVGGLPPLLKHTTKNSCKCQPYVVMGDIWIRIGVRISCEDVIYTNLYKYLNSQLDA